MESKVFSLEMDEKLIDLVRVNPILYDTNTKTYKDVAERNNLWKEIADSLHLDVDQVRTRWRTIRDTHRRNKNRLMMKTFKGSPAFSKSKYTSAALHFLDSTFKMKPSMTSMMVAEPEIEVEEGQSSCSMDSAVYDNPGFRGMCMSRSEVDGEFSRVDEYIEDDSRVFKDNEERNSVQPRKKFKCCSTERLIEVVRLQNEQFNKILTNFLEIKERNRPDEVDPMDMFLCSIAQVVKNFRPELKAKVRRGISQIVTEIELSALEEAAQSPDLPKS